ncbi:MAG TPA: FAD:protein FMN transferase [Gammaproteobacteria bacterium]|nr:FAD:protein FMN transferase [Gammaproteobacteria bacterium]
MPPSSSSIIPLSSEKDFHVEQHQAHFSGYFPAMASPCELLMETRDRKLAIQLTRIAWKEAGRIEARFSRYRKDNIIHRINCAGGAPVEVDTETADLLDYAQTCYRISNGLFDITSGVLREVWHFDGSDRLPSPAAVEAVLQRVGWEKVEWQRPRLRLQPGMEIDLGGIGKEYAVDRVAALLREKTGISVLVNFGGDIAISRSRQDGSGWRVGIESSARSAGQPPELLELKSGALATSGDAYRYLLKDGIRYGHILDPRTGWPAPDMPASVTVAAATCTEAGILSTLAMLQGRDAESFLRQQGVTFRVHR